jgi:arylsulfatase A-like enzyme
MAPLVCWLALGCRPSTTGDAPPTDGPAPSTHSAPSAPHTGASSPSPALVFDGPPPRNLVVLSVDTLRRDHVSRYDPEGRNLTPFLDARMDEGVAVDDWMHCANWTVAASTCLAAGRSLVDLAPELDMVPVLTDALRLVRPVAPHDGLATVLSADGWDTRLFTANGWFGPFSGAVPGFASVDNPGHVGTDALTFRAMADLTERPLRAPFYLHVHGFEPHDPYLPPDRLRDPTVPPPPVPLDTEAQQEAVADRWASFDADEQALLLLNVHDRYQAEVRWYDEQLAALWARLEDAGVLDDALVVFHSDHGEAFYDDHGYFGHGGTLHPEENLGFLVFWARNLVPGATSAPAVAADLAPTILTALGRPVPERMTGIPVGAAPPDRVRTAFTAAVLGPSNAARKGDELMLFQWLVPSAPIVRCNLASDPRCQSNAYRADAVTPLDRELWAAIEAEARAVEAVVTRDDPRHPTPPWPPELVTGR